jgi:hypothetical protein
MNALRFHNAIPNKKGRIPQLKGFIEGSTEPVTAQRLLDGERVLDIVLNTEQFNLIQNQKSHNLYLPAGLEEPCGTEVSRFVAKVAVEAMAQRLLANKGRIQHLIEDTQFDPIRDYARRGTPKEWPISVRRIYGANEDRELSNQKGQIVHEYDFLQTMHNELYFVLALYGIELSINMGGPDIDGYEDWLKENDNISPLYHGKNDPANQQVDPIVTTPVDKVEAQSTQGHP